MDDIAGQAYVEQFGLDTFQRADNAMRANKVSRQTADTFQASSTFLELLQIWGPLDPEMASRIKFAKYHSIRILKALKAGEDPNLSNPAPEPPPIQPPALDSSDPDVQMLNGPDSLNDTQDATRQPSMEEIPDENDRLQPRLAQRSTLNESLHPSRASSIPPAPPQNPPTSYGIPPPQDTHAENFYQNPPPPEVSPLDSPIARDDSGGGYFPSVPVEPTAPTLPSSSLPPSIPPPIAPANPPPSVQPRAFPPPTAPQFRAPPPPAAPFIPPQPQTRPPPPTSSTSTTTFVADEEAILKAQKHAKWAISALNFEDVGTAVNELRGALESLGAT
ncbi:hypothetical protein MMC20_006001 [Loxospora ochrophaea]|nr:hypothetical protein [Loxospora ochrophaea]